MFGESETENKIVFQTSLLHACLHAKIDLQPRCWFSQIEVSACTCSCYTNLLNQNMHRIACTWHGLGIKGMRSILRMLNSSFLSFCVLYLARMAHKIVSKISYAVIFCLMMSQSWAHTFGVHTGLHLLLSYCIISLSLLSPKCAVSRPKDISFPLVWHPHTRSPNYALLPQSMCTGQTLRGKIWQVISSDIVPCK